MGKVVDKIIEQLEEKANINLKMKIYSHMTSRLEEKVKAGKYGWYNEQIISRQDLLDAGKEHLREFEKNLDNTSLLDAINYFSMVYVRGLDE